MHQDWATVVIIKPLSSITLNVSNEDDDDDLPGSPTGSGPQGWRGEPGEEEEPSDCWETDSTSPTPTAPTAHLGPPAGGGEGPLRSASFVWPAAASLISLNRLNLFCPNWPQTSPGDVFAP